jgi:ribose-phosphate pyrophosphokinase
MTQLIGTEITGKILKGKLANVEDAKERNCIFAGTSNPELAKSIADLLGLPLSGLTIANFADGEVSIKVNDSVRQKDVYIIQPVCRVGDKSVNDNLMQLLLLISTFRRASASKICAVIPYYGYARQDRKVSSRTPISAADVATLISVMGVDRVIAVDLHCGQIQGFFPPTVPVDNLNAGIVGAYYFAAKDGLVNVTVVSPDAGGVTIAKEFRKTLVANGHPDAGLAMMIKQRVKANEIDRMDLIGTVTDSDCIIVDDIVDTAGTLCEAARQLKDHGARRIYAFITHGLLNGPAGERISKSHLDELVVTNSVPLPATCVGVANIKQLNLAPVIAETIRCNIERDSVGSSLFA